MSVTATALLAGCVFGARHAVEADHVAAVATLVESGDGRESAATGVAWGIGHSLPVLAVGGLSVALGLRVPANLSTAFEAVVAVVLIALGVRAVRGREPVGLAILSHVHGAGDGGARTGGDGTDGEGSGRDHRHLHLHLRVAGREVGVAHSHASEESFAVGIVHGLAGSGGVAAALAAAAPTAGGGAAFLGGFAAATVAAMGLATWGFGRARAADRAGALRALAGAASVGVGLLLAADVLAGIGLDVAVGT
ncbi:MAG: hypothetical protein ABEH40_06100 [Haloferacaceae archaeon]